MPTDAQMSCALLSAVRILMPYFSNALRANAEISSSSTGASASDRASNQTRPTGAPNSTLSLTMRSSCVPSKAKGQEPNYDAANIAAVGMYTSDALTDGYGGALQARARILLEIVDAVREAIGPGRALGVRICGDELIEGGSTLDEAVEWIDVKAAKGPAKKSARGGRRRMTDANGSNRST